MSAPGQDFKCFGCPVTPCKSGTTDHETHMQHLLESLFAHGAWIGYLDKRNVSFRGLESLKQILKKCRTIAEKDRKKSFPKFIKGAENNKSVHCSSCCKTSQHHESYTIESLRVQGTGFKTAPYVGLNPSLYRKMADERIDPIHILAVQPREIYGTRRSQCFAEGVVVPKTRRYFL